MTHSISDPTTTVRRLSNLYKKKSRRNNYQMEAIAPGDGSTKSPQQTPTPFVYPQI